MPAAFRPSAQGSAFRPGGADGTSWRFIPINHSFQSGLPLIAKIGFLTPVILALWITFNESVGAFLIGCGLLTWALAISAALGMVGALYTTAARED